jgi:hypothetical protein
LIVLRVERRERVALLHRRADVGQARQQLAGDPERQIAFIARLHFADRLAVVLQRLWSRDDRPDRPRRRFRGFRLAACNSRKQRENKKNG